MPDVKTPHQQYADGLRAIADWWEQHPEITLPYAQEMVHGQLDTKEEAALLMRAFGSCSKEYTEDYLRVTKHFGTVEVRFLFNRNQVCERVVVGQELVPAQYIEAQRIPEHTKEIVEWRCIPVLQGNEPGEVQS